MSKFPSSIPAFETSARTRIPEAQWAWVVGAAERGRTYGRSLDQFSEFGLRPSVLAGVESTSLDTSWLHHKVSAPLVAAPIGHLTQFHQSGELGVIEACAERNIHCFVSMHTRRSLEVLAKAAGSSGWSYQVYLYSEPAVVADQIARAVGLGASSVVVTVDSCHRSPSYQRQEMPWDARNHGQRDEAGLPPSRNDRIWNWRMVADLIRVLDVPLILKGVQSVADAAKAIDVGFRGVWLSNHGGRVNETDQSLIREIGEIREKIGHAVPLVVDGGFRTGGDIAKALLLGASQVALGRPLIYGLICGGGEGVSEVIGIASRELGLVLGTLGIANLQDLVAHRDQVFDAFAHRVRSRI